MTKRERIHELLRNSYVKMPLCRMGHRGEFHVAGETGTTWNRDTLYIDEIDGVTSDSDLMMQFVAQNQSEAARLILDLMGDDLPEPSTIKRSFGYSTSDRVDLVEHLALARLSGSGFDAFIVRQWCNDEATSWPFKTRAEAIAKVRELGVK